MFCGQSRVPPLCSSLRNTTINFMTIWSSRVSKYVNKMHLLSLSYYAVLVEKRSLLFYLAWWFSIKFFFAKTFSERNNAICFFNLLTKWRRRLCESFLIFHQISWFRVIDWKKNHNMEKAFLKVLFWIFTYLFIVHKLSCLGMGMGRGL